MMNSRVWSTWADIFCLTAISLRGRARELLPAHPAAGDLQDGQNWNGQDPRQVQEIEQRPWLVAPASLISVRAVRLEANVQDPWTSWDLHKPQES
jgi:hypothetical protein